MSVTQRSIKDQVPVTMYLSVFGAMIMVIGLVLGLAGWGTLAGLAGAYGFVLIILGIFLWTLIQVVIRAAGYTR